VIRFLRILPACALVLAVAACSQDPSPPGAGAEPVAETPARPARTYRIEDFVDSTSIGGASFSHDESRILFSSNRNGVWNVYHLPVTGGDWTAVTGSDTDNSFAVAYFPSDDRMLITRDQGGNELNHLYVIEADGSERDLTPGENLRAMFAGFSHDGERFFVMSNERDARFFDVYAYASEGYQRELIYQNDSGFQPGPVSGDGRWIGLTKTDTTVNNDIYVHDRDSGEVTHLSPHEGAAQFGVEAFAADGSHLLYTSNEGNEFFRLRRYDFADATHSDVQQADWDIAYARYSHDDRYLAVGVNVDGSLMIELYEAGSGRRVALPELPAGEIRGLSIARSEQRMAFYLNGDRQPSDLYTLPIGGEPVQLVRGLNPAIDPADLVDSEVVRFASFDGMQIPNILWKPHQASADNKVPAVVLVHGGPGGQTTRAYSYVAQYLANNGYVVLGINNRGSSGYGKTFFAADDGKHGREPLWDCIEAKKWLQAQDYVDAERIGIMGGSYGGYMTLAALAFHPEEFDVGVNIFGVSNWLRTLESIPPYWESFRQALYAEIGHPETDREFLIATSPLFHADRIVKPLIVLQGANDPRVIQAESDDIVAAVRANGVPVDYVLFDDEGHGFSKKKNQIEGYSRVLAFLDTHLKGKQVAPRQEGGAGGH
jgi:dipeptidyl aminopeptidase/acylaminoacyl peptidase